MDFLDRLFSMPGNRFCFHPLYHVLEEGDEAQAEELLRDLKDPLQEDDAACCLRQALECSPGLFRRILEHCLPGEYTEEYSFSLETDDFGSTAFIVGHGSLLMLAAMADRPEHVRILLEQGYDCNGAGLEMACGLLRDCNVSYQVPLHGELIGAYGNRLEVFEPGLCENISGATPLSAALFCGSLRAAEVLLHWPGVWKGESSAVCRAAGMVLEGFGETVLLRERRDARMALLWQIFCPELPDREPLLRSCRLQSVSFFDLCSVKTLRCQLESGFCTEAEGREMLRFAGEIVGWDNEDAGRTLAGKLLLLKQAFPSLCREPWATGVFLQEVLRRYVNDKPYKTLLKAWKQLSGKERDLTWVNPVFWRMKCRALGRFLDEAGEGGTLVMDVPAVSLGNVNIYGGVMGINGAAGSGWARAFLKRVRLRRREGEGFGQAVRQLLHIGDARTMRLAARQGLLDGEDPRELVRYLVDHPDISQNGRMLVLTLPERQLAEETDYADWQDMRRWPYWSVPYAGEAIREDVKQLMNDQLPREVCLRKMFALFKYMDGFCGWDCFWSQAVPAYDDRYPLLQVPALGELACCAKHGQVMALLLEQMPHLLRKRMDISWGEHFDFRGTALCLSAALGRTEQVRMLLDDGAHPDDAGRGDFSQFIVGDLTRQDRFLPVTPVLAAILFAQEETARLLLERGAVCDFTRPAHRRVLLWGSADTLALAERLPGVGFAQIPEGELEALRVHVAEGGVQDRFWKRLQTGESPDTWWKPFE